MFVTSSLFLVVFSLLTYPPDSFFIVSSAVESCFCKLKQTWGGIRTGFQVLLEIRTQEEPPGSPWGRGAQRDVGPADGTAAWSCGGCSPSGGGWTSSPDGCSTADSRHSRTAAGRRRACRSRGCSSCWGRPAGRTAWRPYSPSLRGSRRGDEAFTAWPSGLAVLTSNFSLFTVHVHGSRTQKPSETFLQTFPSLSI